MLFTPTAKFEITFNCGAESSRAASILSVSSDTKAVAAPHSFAENLRRRRQPFRPDVDIASGRDEVQSGFGNLTGNSLAVGAWQSHGKVVWHSRQHRKLAQTGVGGRVIFVAFIGIPQPNGVGPMTLTRWKLLAGVFGISMVGVVAMANPQCPGKTDSSRVEGPADARSPTTCPGDAPEDIRRRDPRVEKGRRTATPIWFRSRRLRPPCRRSSSRSDDSVRTHDTDPGTD